MTRIRAFFIVAIAGAIAPAASAQFFGGSGSKQTDRATFNVCAGSPCSIGTDFTNHYIASAAGKVKKCYALAKTVPLGAVLTFDIRVNGTSIFGAQPKLTIPAGSAAVATVTAFDNPNVADADQLRIDIVSVGSIAAGQDVSVVCKIQQN
jgi:hypothetical protein